MSITRGQYRQIQKLAERIDRVTQADRRFFERFPHRKHRLRIASQAEIEQHNILDSPVLLPPCCRLFVIVRNIAPGVRFRLFIVSIEGSDTDLDEANARAIFERVATPRTREIEEQMRQAAEARTDELG